MIKAVLTQKVIRPNTNLERQVSFQDWLLKVKSNYYAQHPRVVDACANII